MTLPRLRYPNLVWACLPLLCSCGLPPTLFVLPAGVTSRYQPSTYVSVGDSITHGSTLNSPATQSYPALIAASRGWTLQNDAIPGDMGCDVFPRQIIPNRVAFSIGTAIVYSMLIGTNDTVRQGFGPYEDIFRNCQLAAITWLATSPQDKLLPGDISVMTSGACSNNSSNPAFTCNGTGTLNFGTIGTTGAPLYLWYAVSDTAAPTDTFIINVDGSHTSIATKPQVTISTGNGSTSSIYLLRIPLPAGPHRIQVSASAANINILALASNRSSKPVVLAVGDVPAQRLSSTSVETQLAYTQIVRQNIATAVSDGLDVRTVDDRSYMQATSEEMNDIVHPNQLGQFHLAIAFATQLP